MKKEIVVNVNSKDFDGDYVCSCGNTVMDDGFFAYTLGVGPVEPEPGIWDGHYYCESCGIVIHIEEV